MYCTEGIIVAPFRFLVSWPIFCPQQYKSNKYGRRSTHDSVSYDSFDMLGSMQVVLARLKFSAAYVLSQSQQTSCVATQTQP